MDTDDSTTPEAIRQQIRREFHLYLSLGILLSLIVGGLIGYYGLQPPQTATTHALDPPPGWGQACDPALSADTLGPTPTRPPLAIYVSGAVAQPQVVTLPAGSLVGDALEAAGGATTQADLDQLNLAAPLADHQHLIVPTLVPQSTVPAPAPPATSATPAASGRIDINTADAAALETLPHIGPTRATDIIAYRETHGPFTCIEDIQEVNGIGPATFADLIPLITVTP